MRALNVAGVLVFIQLTIALINYAAIIPGVTIGGYMGPDIVGAIKAWQPSSSDTTSYGILNLMAFVGFLVQSVLFFIFMIGYSTILLPIFLGWFYLPDIVIVIITAGVWLTYLIDYNEYRARMRTMSG